MVVVVVVAFGCTNATPMVRQVTPIHHCGGTGSEYRDHPTRPLAMMLAATEAAVACSEAVRWRAALNREMPRKLNCRQCKSVRYTLVNYCFIREAVFIHSSSGMKRPHKSFLKTHRQHRHEKDDGSVRAWSLSPRRLAACC